MLLAKNTYSDIDIAKKCTYIYLEIQKTCVYTCVYRKLFSEEMHIYIKICIENRHSEEMHIHILKCKRRYKKPSEMPKIRYICVHFLAMKRDPSNTSQYRVSAVSVDLHDVLLGSRFIARKCTQRDRR